MKIGTLPLIRNYRPVTRSLPRCEPLRRSITRCCWPTTVQFVTGNSPSAAAAGTEELEEPARLQKLLPGHATRFLALSQSRKAMAISQSKPRC
jgi:hypothetical protein